MSDWSKYLSGTGEPEAGQDPQGGTEEAIHADTPLTVGMVRGFCGKLSGTHDSGKPKAVISYQQYEGHFKDGQALSGDSVDEQVIYDCTGGVCQMAFDVLNPGVIGVTVAFPAWDDPKLRLLWARLMRWRREDSRGDLPETSVPLFVLLLETEDDGLEAQLINPLMFHLTRQDPGTPAGILPDGGPDNEGRLREALTPPEGGNVVTMLFDMNLVSFSVPDPDAEPEDAPDDDPYSATGAYTSGLVAGSREDFDAMLRKQQARQLRQ